MHKKAIALMLVLLVCPAGAVRADPDYAQIITSETAWVVATQIPTGHGDASGAIPVHPDPSNGQWNVKPYDANIAAWGVLDATGTTYAPQVKAWMNWYFAHLNWPDYNNVYATVYDYYINSSSYVVTSVPDGTTGHSFYDSTDAYAATFLSLCRKYAEVNPTDKQFILQNEYKINQIIGALRATKQADGLTWAKPDYLGKLLMDNAEVYKGLIDAAWLYTNVFTDDPNGYNYYTAQANDVLAGISNVLWNAHTLNMYATVKAADGSTNVVGWSTWYPDATSQLWPIKATITDSATSTALWNSFNANWTNWTTTINNSDGMPWAAAGYTAAIMHDKTSTDAFLNGANTNYIQKGHPWPWSVREAGFTASAANTGKNL